MGASGFNSIYQKLVADENDMLGKLAYSQYKRQKIEYVHAFKNKHGDDPKDSDLNAFHDVSNSESQLEGYRHQAAQLALNFLETSLAHEAKELETLYATKANNEIRSARPGFWKGVSQGIVSSGLFTLLIGCLVFFTWSLKQGPRHVIEQVFDVMIVDAVPANTAITFDPARS